MNNTTDIPNGWVKLSAFEQLTGINGRTIRAAVKEGRIPADYARQMDDTPTAPYYMDPQPAALYWFNNINSNRPLSKAVREALTKYIKTFDDTVGIGVATPLQQMSYAEAQRRERVAKARIAELEVEEREKALVSREMVNKELFELGQALRDALLAIPDRITDEVIANADNRHKVHTTIYNAIADVLTHLADMALKE